VRFGTCDEFPIVLNADLSYEHYSDTLVAATMGRGIYTLKNAKDALLKVRSCSAAAADHHQPLAASDWLPEESSARFFPAQQ